MSSWSAKRDRIQKGEASPWFALRSSQPPRLNRPQKVGQVKVRIKLSYGSGIEPGSFRLN
ncbi:hypothetical protein SAMN05720487_1191, partial [Fibrobacter sp. UWT2]